jgi:hypothetical protein
LKNDNGEIKITIPRDHNGEFDPVIVKKYERTIGPIEDKIISMYAKENDLKGYTVTSSEVIRFICISYACLHSADKKD